MPGKYIIQKAIDRKDMSKAALAALDTKPYWMQPKYDGCHLVIVLRKDGTGGCFSATGEVVRSCNHLLQAMQHLLGTVYEDVAICGEAWAPGLAFPEISGMFRRHEPSLLLRFAPFDMVRIDGMALDDPRSYAERSSPLGYLRPHGYIIPFANYPADLYDEYAKDLKSRGGYDGAILRDPDAPYKVGRCRKGEVVKIKPLLELDLEVIGVKLDKGEKTGKNTAALLVRLRDGKSCYVSTGLTQAEVDELHDNGLPAKTIIAVEAMGWTEDGLLREPRYKGIRHDKVAADY